MGVSKRTRSIVGFHYASNSKIIKYVLVTFKNSIGFSFQSQSLVIVSACPLLKEITSQSRKPGSQYIAEEFNCNIGWLELIIHSFITTKLYQRCKIELFIPFLIWSVSQSRKSIDFNDRHK